MVLDRHEAGGGSPAGPVEAAAGQPAGEAGRQRQRARSGTTPTRPVAPVVHDALPPLRVSPRPRRPRGWPQAPWRRPPPPRGGRSPRCAPPAELRVRSRRTRGCSRYRRRSLPCGHPPPFCVAPQRWRVSARTRRARRSWRARVCPRLSCRCMSAAECCRPQCRRRRWEGGRERWMPSPRSTRIRNGTLGDVRRCGHLLPRPKRRHPEAGCCPSWRRRRTIQGSTRPRGKRTSHWILM